MAHRRLMMLTGLMLAAAGALVGATALADEPAAASPPQTALVSGLSLTAQLLQLMDTDQSGKVSREEFLRFMAAEFDFADKNRDGELDPKELRYLQNRIAHPVRGPGR